MKRLKGLNLKQAVIAIWGVGAYGAVSAQVYGETKNTEPLEQETLTVTGATSTQQTGSYLATESSAATGLNLSPMETPQVVSTITHQQIEDFVLDDLRDLLEMAPGVSVERVETDRTYYTARGFDIINFQLDGMGVPAIYGNQIGNRDTVMFDKVEVLKGANGLMSGFGSPSATINMVRKRPTQETEASATALYGSWARKRLQGDVSGSLNQAGSVRGLFAGAVEDKASYLDRYESQRKVGYGVIEADLTDRTLFTVGVSYQEGDADSPFWGALPLQYSNGNPTDYDDSTSTSTDWAKWDTKQRDAFVEVQQDITPGWTLTARLTHTDAESDSALFYVYGSPDQDTGEGLGAWPSSYTQDVKQNIVDVNISGPFEFADLTHDLLIGAQTYRSHIRETSVQGSGIGTPLTEDEVFSGSFPEPTFDGAVSGSDFKYEQNSLYAAGRFSLHQQVSLVSGLRISDFESEGEGYGTVRDIEIDREVIPYAGLIYQFNNDLTAYASYTAIFEPQEEVDITRETLEPIDGEAYEAGIKTLLNDGRAQATFAVFRSKQDNVAELAGAFPDTGTNYYRAVEGVTSNGFELEFAGEVLENWMVSTGYIYLDLEDADGKAARTFIPQHSAKLATTYQLPDLPVKVGATMRWQDEVSTDAATQESYTLVDLMARYEVSEHWSAQLNVSNVTDEKYLNSLYWDQSYYGEPRSASLSVNWSL